MVKWSHQQNDHLHVVAARHSCFNKSHFLSSTMCLKSAIESRSASKALHPDKLKFRSRLNWPNDSGRYSTCAQFNILRFLSCDKDPILDGRFLNTIQ